MIKQASISALAAIALTGCASNKIPEHQAGLPQDLAQEWRHGGALGKAPSLSYFPQAANDKPYTNHAEETSLWSSAPRSLFGDRRASQNGDILTVVIEIDDEAEMQNTINQSTQTNQGFSIGALFGLPELVNKALPDGASLSPAVQMDRGTNSTGNGNIKRGEKIALRLAAQVTGIMPNGYLAVSGKQEIMVNNEGRYLQVTGIIRNEDISRMNTITYDKIANAKIFYGGQGSLSDTVRPKAGQKALNKYLPF